MSTDAEGEEHSTDVLRIARPDDLADLASLGLTLGESKPLLAGLQQESVAAQARVHAARRPECRSCGTTCRLKDYRQAAARRSRRDDLRTIGPRSASGRVSRSAPLPAGLVLERLARDGHLITTSRRTLWKRVLVKRLGAEKRPYACIRASFLKGGRS